MDISNTIRTIQKADQYRKAALVAGKTFRPVTTVAHRFGPEILTGTGILGGVGTVILASKATLRLEEIVDRTKHRIEYAENEKAARKAKAEGYLEIAKLYGPTATLGTASIVAILGAHGVMRRRNVTLLGAYKALETTFEEYRKRVTDEVGEEKERDFRYGFTNEEKQDKKTGEITTETTVKLNSPYAVIFDEGNENWAKNSEYNKVFLTAQQNYANDKLKAQHYLFLNDVYRMLGFKDTKAGAVCGWYLHKGGDNYVDFNIFDMSSQSKRNFINGYERSILLDFNVDGVMFDKI